MPEELAVARQLNAESLSRGNERRRITRRVTEEGLLVVEGKNVAAGMALKVIEYAGIDFFTHARASQAANGTAGQTAEDGTG